MRTLAVLSAFLFLASDVGAEPTQLEVSVPAPAADQSIGGQLGFDVGGRVSPGGVRAQGAYLYRLSDRDWLESTLAFTFGGAGDPCAPGFGGQMDCNDGYMGGFGMAAGVRVRRYFSGMAGWVPFGFAGVEAKLATFSRADITGFAVPLIIGGGVRKAVSDDVALVGAASVHAGAGYFNRELGWEPHAAVAVSVGAEFDLK